MKTGLPSRTWTTGALVLMIGAGAAACDRSTEAPPPVTDAAVTQPAIPRSDSWITTSVQAKYYGDDEVRGGNVDVSSANGVVTLRGTVQDQQARQRAVALARDVEGVTRVEDQLQVETQQQASASGGVSPEPATPARGGQQATGTTGPGGKEPASGGGDAGAGGSATLTPAWITTKITAQYFANPDVKPWNVDVTTTGGGVVTLRGDVGNQRARTEALRIARETEGVSRVEDQLRIQGEARTGDASAAAARAESGPDQPDTWVTAKVQSKYFLDDDVKGRDIDVTTKGGVVTLSGTVVSEAERRQAVALARNTEGVRDVTDNLQVHNQAAAKGPGSGSIEKVPTLDVAANDTRITTRIQSNFFLDRQLKSHDIAVNTRKGVVTLKGQVPAAPLKEEAERIARETSGVSRVINEITVAGN